MAPVRFFILGIPHTITSDDYCACAYTGKVLRLCAMLRKLGHYVIHVGHEDSVVDCDEHISVTTQYDLRVAYPGFDHHKEVFKFDLNDHIYRTFAANAVVHIGLRKQPNDFLLCAWGAGHRAVADAHPDMIVVESGIGYAGGYFARWRVWESYSLLHAYAGLHAVGEAGHLGNYDVVIPNHFNISQFDFDDQKEDYFLALGRVNCGKGVHIAVQLCEALGVRLVVAGQGTLADVGYGGAGQPPIPPNVEFVGHADVEQRRRLFAKARAAFVLSQYSEPFGGVAVEAMMSGTPVITSDWGAFTETVPHGLVGYRCRTFGHMLWAARNIGRIRPADCRAWAIDNYSCDRIAPMYDEYFRSVLAVYTGKGWYEPEPDRPNLDWLTKRYPPSPVFATL